MHCHWRCVSHRVVARGARRWWASRLCRASSTRPHTAWEGIITDGQPMINSDFVIVEQKTIHSRYFDVVDRRIQFPARNEEPPAAYDFDVIGHPRSDYRFAVVLPFHPYTDGRAGGEVTVCKEFAQGVVAMMYTLPAGGYDPKKHPTIADCAAAEMNEEAQLMGGDLIPLVPLDVPGIPESKWCANRFHPFLCISPVPNPNPPPRDAEEFIEVLRMDIAQLKQIAMSGNMLQPSVVTTMFALDKLTQLGYL